MSEPLGFCTVEELKLACRWMETEFDGTIDVIHRRNTNRGYMPFQPEDVVPANSHVVVVMQKRDHDPRTVGIFRAINTATDDKCQLWQVGNKGAGRWVIMLRLAIRG